MKESLENIFVDQIHKEELISNINAIPEKFKQAVKIALSNEEAQAWRAAWILGHCIHKNDPRLGTYITDFIQALEGKKDGHQRELLKILEKMDFSDEQEGLLFDECMNIWETAGKSPSVRLVAFKVLIKIANKYPELNEEIAFLTQPEYLETLSPGIKRSLMRIWEEYLDNTTLLR